MVNRDNNKQLQLYKDSRVNNYEESGNIQDGFENIQDESGNIQDDSDDYYDQETGDVQENESDYSSDSSYSSNLYKTPERGLNNYNKILKGAAVLLSFLFLYISFKLIFRFKPYPQREHRFNTHPAALLSVTPDIEFKEQIESANLSTIKNAINKLNSRKDYINKIIIEANGPSYLDNLKANPQKQMEDRSRITTLKREIEEIDHKLKQLNDRKLELE